MADEAKFRVRLETQQARGELASLVRESARVAGQVSAGIRSTVGRGLGIVGMGAGFGAGAAALKAATQSGVADVAGEALGGIGQRVADFFFGDMNETAKGTARAREEAINTFGFMVGSRGAIPQGVHNWFESVKSLRVQEERGREIFESDDRFRGPGIGSLVERIGTVIGTELKNAADYLWDKWKFWKSK